MRALRSPTPDGGPARLRKRVGAEASAILRSQWNAVSQPPAHEMDLSRLRSFLSAVGLAVLPEQLEYFFHAMDDNGNGVVAFGEFLDWYPTLLAQHEYNSDAVQAQAKAKAPHPHVTEPDDSIVTWIAEHYHSASEHVKKSLADRQIDGLLRHIVEAGCEDLEVDVAAILAQYKAKHKLFARAAKAENDSASVGHGSFGSFGSFNAKSGNFTGDTAKIIADTAAFTSAMAVNQADMRHTYTACCVLFVDISGYSKATAALAERGTSAHVLSEVVNSYLRGLVDTIQTYGGDVVKYAGDALVVLWYSGTDKDVLQAAGTALALQKHNGERPVLDTGLKFRIHVGAARGMVTSRLFRVTHSGNMPSHFHFIFGEPMMAAGEACNVAKAGEVCVTTDFADKLAAIGAHADVKPVPTQSQSFQYLVGMASDPTCDGPPHKLCPPARFIDFMPRAVSQKVLAGYDKMFMAEMRNLVVLFIKLAASAATDEEIWFMEVCDVLQRHSCAVIQIIDDDKGTHVVAAFNLYRMEDNSAELSVAMAQELKDRGCQCIIGIASGEVFCGVIGGESACQWDITGAAVVRACRVMQHAEAEGLSEALDASVVHELSDKRAIKSVGSIHVKGTTAAVEVYCLKQSAKALAQSDLFFLASRASGVLPQLEAAVAGVANERGKQNATTTLLIQGPVGSGKFSACLTGLRHSTFVPVVHTSSEGSHRLQLSLLLTICDWFHTHSDAAIAQACEAAAAAIRSGNQNAAFRHGIALLKSLTEAKESFALIVRRAQLLDRGSIAFLEKASSVLADSPYYVCYLVCFPLYGIDTPQTLFQSVPNMRFEEATVPSLAGCTNLMNHMFKGTACAASFVAKVATKAAHHVESIVELCERLQEADDVTIRRGEYDVKGTSILLDEPWSALAPRLQRKTIHLLDRLPPDLLTLVKIVAAITEQPGISAFFYSVNCVVKQIMQAELDESLVKALQDRYILRLCEHKCTAHSGNGELDAAMMYTLPMRDVVQDILVPKQRTQINSICGDVYSETHPMDHPMQFLVRARHYLFAGDERLYEHDLASGWRLLQKGDFANKAEIEAKWGEWIQYASDPAVIIPDEEDRRRVLKTAMPRGLKRRSTGGKRLSVGSNMGSDPQGSRSFLGRNVDNADLRFLRTFEYPVCLGVLGQLFDDMVDVLSILANRFLAHEEDQEASCVQHCNRFGALSSEYAAKAAAYSAIADLESPQWPLVRVALNAERLDDSLAAAIDAMARHTRTEVGDFARAVSASCVDAKATSIVGTFPAVSDAVLWLVQSEGDTTIAVDRAVRHVYSGMPRVVAALQGMANADLYAQSVDRALFWAHRATRGMEPDMNHIRAQLKCFATLWAGAVLREARKETQA